MCNNLDDSRQDAEQGTKSKIEKEIERESEVTWYREPLTGGMSHFFPQEHFGAIHRTRSRHNFSLNSLTNFCDLAFIHTMVLKTL